MQIYQVIYLSKELLLLMEVLIPPLTALTVETVIFMESNENCMYEFKSYSAYAITGTLVLCLETIKWVNNRHEHY